ncbi:MAG: TolC family protein, partial [Planctomycetaceae bacterium]
DLENGEDGFEAAIDQLAQIREGHSKESRVKTIRGLTAWIQSYLQLVERLSLVPAQARLEVIAVDQVELDPEAAYQIALANRLDFMNGRAALVDRWRAIQVAADALQSNLTITGSGDVSTARNNPVDFKAATGSLRLGVEFDAPLARLLERNGYRETLIDYQRSRRDFIQSHDSLQKGLRALLRTLEQRRLQLEIQRRAVSIALRRVDQTQLSLLTPPPQGQPGARPQINPTTAINLLSAQGSLQNSQNSFLSAWLNYYAARLRLYRELGVMQLDPNGRWIENAFDFESLEQPVDADAIETETEDLLDRLPPPIPIDVTPAEPER